MPSEDAPPTLRRLRDRTVLVAPIRFALAAACGTLAAAAGASPSVALVAFALGCFGFAAVVLSDRRSLLLAVPRREPVPDDASYASRWRAAASACFPSTAVLTALALVALLVDPKLAALLAGGIAGLGLAGLVAGAQLGLRERGEGVELYDTAGSRVLYERRTSDQ